MVAIRTLGSRYQPHLFTARPQRSIPTRYPARTILNNKNITKEDYTHASKVWEVFNVQSLGEYSDLYLKTDLLLLSDIFENFRRHCLSTYNLDPLHYYTAPGLAFDAMLKHTGIELELLADPEMLLFIEWYKGWCVTMLKQICQSK